MLLDLFLAFKALARLFRGHRYKKCIARYFSVRLFLCDIFIKLKCLPDIFLDSARPLLILWSQMPPGRPRKHRKVLLGPSQSKQQHPPCRFLSTPPPPPPPERKSVSVAVEVIILCTYQCKSRGGGGRPGLGRGFDKNVRKLIKCPQEGKKIPIK